MGNMFSDTNLPIIVHPFPAPGDGGQNGQWHFVSTGTSSFNDGKTQYSGTHVHSNVNGEVHQETTGNLPEGFFQSVSQYAPSPVATTAAILVVSMIVVVAMLSIFVSLSRKKQRRQQHELRNRRNLSTVAGAGANRELFTFAPVNPYKRYFADVMWNSQLLVDEELVEIKVDE